MNFRIIQGGLESRPQRSPSRTIEDEARRRIASLGYDAYRIRKLATDEPIPKAIDRVRMQIEFVAQTLSALAAPPEDFTDDAYWPHP
ncbi:hypothetical protein [Rhizobium sp. FKL33]|uniref:hypothetical protein n=1 Tax=Rhizobium sp. FKL33 TaxID=2562307 RepID=UPI0010BFC931|nr:hypothetical protein [Rhizobium sp. FKL33]